MHALCYMPWVVCKMWNWMEHRMEHGLGHGLEVDVITKWVLIKIYDRGVRRLMAGYGKNICTLAGPDSHMHSESRRLYRTSHMCYILYKFSYSCYGHQCPPWTDYDNTSFQYSIPCPIPCSAFYRTFHLHNLWHHFVIYISPPATRCSHFVYSLFTSCCCVMALWQYIPGETADCHDDRILYNRGFIQNSQRLIYIYNIVITTEVTTSRDMHDAIYH